MTQVWHFRNFPITYYILNVNALSLPCPQSVRRYIYTYIFQWLTKSLTSQPGREIAALEDTILRFHSHRLCWPFFSIVSFWRGVGNVIFIMFTTANHILCSVPAWFTNGFLWQPMWKWIQSPVSGWACLRVLYFLLLTEGPFLTLFSSFAAKWSTGLLLMLVAWSWVAVNENETYSDLSHRARSRQRNEP